MQTFSMTDKGRTRNTNQDYVFCEENAVGSFPNLFIVADGMGGHNAGDTASRMCVEEVVSQIEQSTKVTPIGIFEQAVAAANEKVFQASLSEKALNGMGTTHNGRNKIEMLVSTVLGLDKQLLKLKSLKRTGACGSTEQRGWWGLREVLNNS